MELAEVDATMPVYPYRCPLCGDEGDLTVDLQTYGARHPDCPSCHVPMRRVYTTFAFKPSMPAHYNLATGSYVSNERDFAEQLKRRSEYENTRHRIVNEQSEVEGLAGTDDVKYEVDLKPVDPADQRDVFGITDEGMDETRRRHRELGWTERKTLFL